MNKLLLFALAGLFILQLHNLSSYPLTRGFDAPDHIAYVNYIKIHKQIPLADKGWEFYHPPLYYLIAGIFSDIREVRSIHFASYVILLIFIFIFMKKITRKQTLALTAVLLAGSLPAVIYMTPPISNELFSAAFISLTLIWYLLQKKKSNIFSSVILGVLLGLSILSKSTAWTLVLCISIDLLLDKKIKLLFCALSVMMVVGGWFYIRNLIVFHNPLIVASDFPKFAIHQIPGYRDLGFFTDMKGFFTMDLFHAQHYSLWAGTYFSWFFDGQNVIIPVQAFSKIGILLVICSLPIFAAFILGCVKTLKKSNNSRSVSRVLLIYPAALFLAYIIYNFKIPAYSSVKGIYLLSCIVPFTYFVIMAIQPWKKYYWLFNTYLIIYSILVIKAFWILPWWYNKL